MKVYLENGVVKAEAETMEDVHRLIGFQKAEDTVDEYFTPEWIAKHPMVSPKPIVRKQRRASYKKACDVCGKKFRGVKVHKAFAHDGKHYSVKEKLSSGINTSRNYEVDTSFL